MEYEKCYVFEPEDSRPIKRRRVEPRGLQASWNQRKKAFAKAWRKPQQRIDEKLKTINAATVGEVVAYLDQAVIEPQDERIPTGLILAGANSALRTSIASQIAAHASGGVRRIFVSLSSNAGTNLKGALKTVTQKATSRSSDDDEDEELEDSSGARKGPKLLNYDLQALYDYVQERRIQQVVIAIEDTEAFDRDLLSELIELFGCWHGRIPFACLFNVATSVEFLQQRLSRASVRCLSGRLFDAALSGEEIEQVFEALTDSDNSIFLGAGIMTLILERQTDYIQSIDSFIQAAHYAYMSCYYANALSIFLDPTIDFEAVTTDHFEALRNTPSFRDHVQECLDSGSTKEARNLLDSNESLFDFAVASIQDGKRAVHDMMIGTDVLRILQQRLTPSKVSAKSKLYVQAMSGRLATLASTRELLLSLRKAPSDIALQTLDDIANADNIPINLKDGIRGIAKELDRLLQGQENAQQPLRSEDDIKNSTLRTTVIAQKVELSIHKSALSKQDSAYTTLVRRLSDMLESYFETCFIHPKSLAMNEVFVYDLQSPYREVFAPRPRAAIERALAAPHDYLSCECCQPQQGDSEEATLAGTQPTTAILYQLYLESGNLINVSDLWQAFQAVIGDEEEEGEQKTMALFQRALADLRYLGFVKHTRKRVDHIAKVAWKGL